MRAVCFHGKEDVRVDTVPDPKIVNPRDAILKVTSTAICGSDLHLYGGFIPTMQSGDVLGHEFMGEVVEVGKNNTRLKVGDRVVVPFTIACGKCYFCHQQPRRVHRFGGVAVVAGAILLLLAEEAVAAADRERYDDALPLLQRALWADFHDFAHEFMAEHVA